MKKLTAILVVVLVEATFAITPLLGPAWSKPLAPAWRGRSGSAWTMNGGTSSGGQTTKRNKFRNAWLVSTTLVDSHGNILSDDDSKNKLYLTQHEAENYYENLCRSMESLGWRLIKDGVYEKDNTICNVFLKTIYVYNN